MHEAHLRSNLKLISYLLLLNCQEFQWNKYNLTPNGGLNLIGVPQLCAKLAFAAYPVWWLWYFPVKLICFLYQYGDLSLLVKLKNNVDMIQIADSIFRKVCEFADNIN